MPDSLTSLAGTCTVGLSCDYTAPSPPPPPPPPHSQTLKENGVLSTRCSHGQLVKGQDLPSSLENPGPSSLSHTQGTYLNTTQKLNVNIYPLHCICYCHQREREGEGEDSEVYRSVLTFSFGRSRIRMSLVTVPTTTAIFSLRSVVFICRTYITAGSAPVSERAVG